MKKLSMAYRSLFEILTAPLLLIFIALPGQAKVTLNRLSTLYLPANYTDTGAEIFTTPYEMDFRAAYHMVHWPEHNMAATIGQVSNTIRLVDLSNPSKMEVTHVITSEENMLSLVKCKDFLLSGEVGNHFAIYQLIIKRKKLRLLKRHTLRAPCCPSVNTPIVTGAFTSDCSKLIVGLLNSFWVNGGYSSAAQGAPRSKRSLDGWGNDEGRRKREKRDAPTPESFLLGASHPGWLFTLEFPRGDLTTSTTPPMVQVQGINTTTVDQFTTLFASGVKLLGYGLAIESTPSDIQITRDDRTAIVHFDQQNAIALVNLQTNRAKGFQALGLKDWSQTDLDLSDKDGGINYGRYNVYSPRSYVDARVVKLPGRNLLLTGNGVPSAFSTFSWVPDFEPLVAGRLNNIDSAVISAMGDQDKLRRTAFDRFYMLDDPPAFNNESEFTKLVIPGARGFSLWDINSDTIDLAYDSGDSLAKRHQQDLPELFSSDITNYFNNQSRKDRADFSSPFDGNAVRSVESLTQNQETYLFIGTLQGTILVYHVKNDEQLKVSFNSLNFHGQIEAKIDVSYRRKKLGDAFTTALSIVPAERSVTGRPLLLSLGAYTATLTLWDIMGIPVKTGGGGSKPIPSTATISYTATARVKFYINGKLVNRKEGNPIKYWQTAKGFTFDGQVQTIAVELNYVGAEKAYAGHRGLVMYLNQGPIKIRTNTNWRCTAKKIGGEKWLGMDYNDSKWPEAEIFGSATRKLKVTGIDRTAKWIWATDFKADKGILRCRYKR